MDEEASQCTDFPSINRNIYKRADDIRFEQSTTRAMCRKHHANICKDSFEDK